MASKSRNRRNTAKRGFVNNTILECLLDGDKYGYEIIKDVKEKTDGKIVLKEPSLYSSLKRFEQKGYISSYWGDSDIGGRRHYYSLTEPGRVYYNKLKSPSDFSLDDDNVEDEEISNQEQNEQLTLDNLSEEIYNIEEDVEEVDDENYINHMTFNVEDRMNELLSSNSTPQINEITTNEEVYDEPEEYLEEEQEFEEVDEDGENKEIVEEDLENIETEENTFELSPTTEDTSEVFNEDLSEENIEEIEQCDPEDIEEENEEELIDEFNSVINEQNNLEENSDDDNIQKNNAENKVYEDYMYEHTFRKENKQEVTSGKEKYIQYDLFNNTNNQQNYVDSPSITPESSYKIEEKEQKTANNTETVISKEIPLIQENEVEFFNWNELKRQAATDKTSFLNSTISNNNTKNYSLETNDYKKEDDYKTTNDLHNLLNDNNEYTTTYKQTKIFNNITPNNNNNRIFDNVKERIELSDAVMGISQKQENTYNDEPELTPEQVELLNKKFKEKFNQIAEEKVSTKSEPDYKKILGDLYYKDIETSNDFNNNVNYTNENTNELVSNDIEDEKIESAINKAKVYSYTTLQESLTNDGFKFKPYAADMEEEIEEEFVKINKVRLIFGSIMALIMLLQTAGVFIILKLNNLVYTYDIALYVLAIVASITTFIVYLIPYLTKKDERKIKYYNLNYHIMFGILYLFCGLVLTYAINLVIGLNNANTLSFLSRLILPAILLTNFVFAPIVYKMVMESKNIK